MIRLAAKEDAEQLFLLNKAFNGPQETSLEEVKKSLTGNQQEIVVVAEADGRIVGFICVQIKQSFCYSDPSAEITEVFVLKKHRRKKLASQMISFAEAYCAQYVSIHRITLLTGKENFQAQALYHSLGYRKEEEQLLSKYL
ncbi:putative acetyltransferase [uncultured Ruminococcus sp.]|nr:putative acetyltransferase [uncultured Ruminococcus sp.]SCH77157.1 putative acetyltransferase [uncultured Clostridium sp.]